MNEPKLAITSEKDIKINKTAIDIIETSVEVIKLFCLIPPGSYGVMLESFSEILIKHINYQKNERSNLCGNLHAERWSG